MRRWLILNQKPLAVRRALASIARANADGALSATEDFAGLAAVIRAFQVCLLSQADTIYFIALDTVYRANADGADAAVTENFPGLAAAMLAFDQTPITS